MYDMRIMPLELVSSRLAAVQLLRLCGAAALATSLAACGSTSGGKGGVAQRGTYKIAQNPNFVAEIRAELKKRGLDDNAEIVTMCRSGSERGKPSADFLRANGFPNARYVIDGFQGSAIKEGEREGGDLVADKQVLRPRPFHAPIMAQAGQTLPPDSPISPCFYRPEQALRSNSRSSDESRQYLR